MRKLLVSLTLTTILLVGCTFTTSVDQRGVFISWPRVIPSMTPAPTLTPTATGTPTPTLEPSPTPEVNVTVIPSTPVVFPTPRPLAALMPLYIMNVRSGAGTTHGVLRKVDTSECIPVDTTVRPQANNHTWMQIYHPFIGEGAWMGVKVVGGAYNVRFFEDARCISAINVPLP